MILNHDAFCLKLPRKQEDIHFLFLVRVPEKNTNPQKIFANKHVCDYFTKKYNKEFV